MGNTVDARREQRKVQVAAGCSALVAALMAFLLHTVGQAEKRFTARCGNGKWEREWDNALYSASQLE